VWNRNIAEVLIRGKGVSIIRKAAAVFVFALLLPLLLQSHGECRLGRFKPTVTTWFGRAEVNVTYEDDENKFQGRGRDTTRFDVFGKITIGIGGFVYHPNFAIYNLSVGAGIQESYFRSGEIEGWDFNTIKEYEAKILFLPTHKYGLELFSRRRNPFIQQYQSAGINPIHNEHGLNLYYESRPLSLGLNYSLEDLRLSRERTDTETLNLRGGSVLGPFVTRVNYSISSSDSTTLSRSNIDNLYFQNKFVYRRISNDLSLRELKQFQDTRDKAFTDRLTELKDRVLLELPKDLDASLNYRIRRIKREAAGIESFGDTKEGGIGLVHRFYQSITSRYNYTTSDNETDRSTSDVNSHRGRVNYRKNIRHGVLYAAASGRWSDTKRTGTVRILNETHEASLIPPDERFSLDEVGVDEQSIIVLIEEPVTGIFFEMIRDLHYMVETIGNTTFITVISVGGISPLIAGDGPFTFRVDYLLPAQKTRFDTISYTYSANLDLFDRMLKPFFSISSTEQKVKEGIIPGGAEKSFIYTVGVTVHRKPYTFGGEYQNVDSRISPLTRWRITGDYWERINHTTSLNIKARYQQTDYMEGEGEFRSLNVFREDLFTLVTRANFVFRKRNITMYASNSLSYRKTLTRTYGVGFGSGLNWKVGLLNLNTGLNISYRVSELPAGDLVSQHRFFFLRIIRELF
jgi:hypothetical protein